MTEMYDDVQCLVVCSKNLVAIDELIKAASNNDVQTSEALQKEPLSTKWIITNKYFTADVKTFICTIEQFLKHDAKAFKSLEALVVVFELLDNSTFLQVQHLVSNISLENVEVRLLLNIEEEKSSEKLKDELFSWTIKNNFELVEKVSDDVEQDDGFEEKFGVDRILEALNSHVWSNHVRKDEQLLTACTAAGYEKEEKTVQIFNEASSFEKMFEKFEEMKEKARSLEGEARKEYAEQVTLAFMEALGISDDEEDEAKPI
ncbi:alpha- and gamma-adaptin-binding protein p34-like [Hydractinia symbiolongicarpus]|uniref:alpha- and gamma-adaptin-binding protein p34-like n=1 Tax=Hydractinia symbiolongicarpus TaxID=13093 RepID=UPI00254A8DD1|nr:alpha- and gamma-adaptin-binding protein p34-like [Hydractinia symbiolongicarpus]